MVDTPNSDGKTHDTTGRDDDSGVDGGNDAFSEEFDAIAAGPAAGDEKQKDGDDDAGQTGADDGDDESPNDGATDNGPQADASGKPAAGETPDPWANAPPALIAERDKLIRQYEQRVQGASGRASGLQRQLNALKSTAPAPDKTSTGKLSDEDRKKREDRIKALREDYPEIAGPILELIEDSQTELAALRGQTAPVIAASEEEVLVQAQQGIEAKHADWRAYGTDDTPEYATWLAAQPEQVKQSNQAFRGWITAQSPGIQALADSWDPEDVAVVLSKFKTERGEATKQAGGGDDPKPNTATDDKRRRQLDAGKVVGSRPGSAASGAPDDFDGAFDHFQKRIDAQKK